MFSNCFWTGPVLESSRYNQCHSTDENRFSISQSLLAPNRVLVSSSTLEQVSLLSAYLSTWTCIAGLMYAVLVSVSSHLQLARFVQKLLSCWSCVHLLPLIIFPPRFSHRSLIFEWRDLIKVFYVWLSVPKSLTACCPVPDLCIHYHLHEEEPSLLRIEQCTLRSFI